MHLGGLVAEGIMAGEAVMAGAEDEGGSV